MQGFDSPQQPQLSGPKSPQRAKADRQPSPNSPHLVNPDNKENALPEPHSTSRKSPGSPMPGRIPHCLSAAVTGRWLTWHSAVLLAKPSFRYQACAFDDFHLLASLSGSLSLITSACSATVSLCSAPFVWQCSCLI